ncbi:autoinducer binding domain-containing protein [uncultured Limimaricola sp.]|uniref:helix-turn-helix transcriptional regulator n=1 Tax=uncultured Limimaricola sp. TaxID=2211667 RepID=UPI0030FA6947
MLTSTTALSFISRAARVGDDAILWDMLCDRMMDYGMDRLLYGFTFLPEPDTLDPGNWVLRSSHCDGYTRRLVADGLYLDTRYGDWARHNSGTLLWSRQDMLPHGDPSSEARLRDLNRTHGVHAGAMISFPMLPQKTRASLVLAAQSDIPQCRLDRIWLQRREEIEAQLHAFHLRFQLIYTDSYHLTPRQKEVLRFVAAGLSVQQIADELKLSVATVDKHLRLAREAFGASTTAQAVARAIRFHQLYA